MVRVLFIFALLVAAASAFVAPAQHAVTTPAFARKTSVQMVPVETATEIISSVAQNAQLIATNADEFGGYFYPVAGLALLSTLILYLSPPLADN